MAYEECEHCGWGFPEPGLAEAVFGVQECTNCDAERILSESERRETLENFDQRLHVAEREIARLSEHTACTGQDYGELGDAETLP